MHEPGIIHSGVFDVRDHDDPAGGFFMTGATSGLPTNRLTAERERKRRRTSSEDEGVDATDYNPIIINDSEEDSKITGATKDSAITVEDDDLEDYNSGDDDDDIAPPSHFFKKQLLRFLAIDPDCHRSKQLYKAATRNIGTHPQLSDDEMALLPASKRRLYAYLHSNTDNVLAEAYERMHCLAFAFLQPDFHQQLQTTVFAARVLTPLRSLRALLHLLERGERYHFQHSTTKVYAIWYEHRYLLRRSLSIFSSLKPIGRCSFNSPSVSRLRQSFEFTGMSFDTSLARRPEDHGPSPRAVPAHRLTQPTTP
jgi:hypothetical protein